jgi:hypothetical protein
MTGIHLKSSIYRHKPLRKTESLSNFQSRISDFEPSFAPTDSILDPFENLDRFLRIYGRRNLPCRFAFAFPVSPVSPTMDRGPFQQVQKGRWRLRKKGTRISPSPCGGKNWRMRAEKPG